MLTVQQKGVIALIKSALDGRAYSLPKDFDLADAIDVAMKHKIAYIIYYGAIQCGIDRRDEKMQKLFRYVVSAMAASSRQHQAHLQLMRAFEEKAIEYMPLKGFVLQELYPQTAMRTMGDADVLIRMEQYHSIQQIMTSLEYEFVHEYYHELVWRSGDVEIELHKSIVPPTNTKMYAYFGDGWKFARKRTEQGTRYDLSYEEFYIHTFAHLTKHYMGAGVGIKHMLDLWVYRRAFPRLDEQHIDRALEEMGLLEFHNNVMATLGVWFADEETTAVTDYITSFVFTSGVFGMADNLNITKLLKAANKTGSARSAKRQALRKRMFPSRESMKEKYPVLVNAPYLLPVMWIVHWFKVLFFKRSSIKAVLLEEGATSAHAIDQRKRMYEAVGLDFSAYGSAE